MTTSRNFKYYQPNKKDVKDKYGDCTIRALSKALEKSWIETFDSIVDFMRDEQCLLSGMTLMNIKYKGI